MASKKIGTIHPDGSLTYPEETITGRPYQRAETDPAPSAVHGLGGKHFAVGETFLPKGFDLQAELDALTKEAKGVSVTKTTAEGEAKA